MPTIWIDTVFDVDVASGTSRTDSLMTGVSSTQTRFDRMTLLRTIVGLDVARAVHDSGEGSEKVSLGIGVTSQEAFAAGIVADPETASDFPVKGWVWRASYRVYGFAADQPAVFNVRIDKDLRGNRKLENGEMYMATTVAALEGSNSSTTIVGIVRQLWLVG